MSRTKIRIIVFLILNFLILAIMAFLVAVFYAKMPSEIVLTYTKSGDAAAKASNKSLIVMLLLYAAAFVFCTFVFKFYKRIKFKNKIELEKLPEDKKLPVYDLIKESILAICFFFGLCLMIIQNNLIKLGLGKVKSFSYAGLIIAFIIFLSSNLLYKNYVNKFVLKTIDSAKTK